MPQVPKLNPSNITQQAALPRVRFQTDNAPLEAFGGGAPLGELAKATDSAFDLLNQYVKKQKNDADDVAVQEAVANTIKKKNELFWGSDDGQVQGAISREGKAAAGINEEYGTKFKEYTDETYNSLSNEDQKRRYQIAAANQSADFSGMLNKHFYAETKKVEDQTFKASIGAYQDDAVRNFSDPGKVQNSIALQEMAIRDRAEKTGMTVEQADVLVRNAVSTTHKQVLTRMLNNDQDLLAKKYFEENKDQMSGLDMSSMEKNIESSSIRGESQRWVDEKTAPKYNEAGQPIPSTKPTMSQVLEQTKSIEDPQLRDATVNRIKDHYSTQKAAERYDNEQQMHTIFNTVRQTKELPPVTQMNQLDPSQQSAVYSWTKMVRAGIDPVNDDQLYYDTIQLAINPNTMNDFLEKNISAYRTKLDRKHWETLVNLQAGLRKQDARAQNELDGYRTNQQIVNDSLASAGFDPTPKDGTTNSKVVASFRRQVDEQVAQLESQTGKKVTNKELQGITDKLLTDVIVGKGYFYGNRTKKQFQAIDDIPLADRVGISSELQKAGVVPTPENILRAYKRFQGMTSGTK